MKLLKTGFTSYKAVTTPVHPVPDSVQDTIPVNRIAKDGIFELEPGKGNQERLYDKAYWFTDVNYDQKSKTQKHNEVLTLYVRFLNSLKSSFKLILFNGDKDVLKMKREVFLKHINAEKAKAEADQEHSSASPEQYNAIIDSFNKIISDNMLKTNNGIEREHIFIVSTKAKSFEEARIYFHNIEAQMMSAFKSLGSRMTPMDAEARVKLLYAFYNIDTEKDTTTFEWSFDEAVKSFRNWKNDIAPGYISAAGTDGQFLKIGSSGRSGKGHTAYVSVLRPTKYPNFLGDNTFTALTSNTFHLACVLDVSPIDKSTTIQHLQSIYDNIEVNINRQQQKINDNGMYSQEISVPMQNKKEEIKTQLDIANKGDDNMVYAGVYVAVWGATKAELSSRIDQIERQTEGMQLPMYPYRYHQLEAFETCLPTCSRRTDAMRTMFMGSLCCFTPFSVSELTEKGGLYYGINSISKNVVIGNREKLANGNGFILGKSGFGKSMFTKLEIIQYACRNQDDVMIIDPQNEYESLIRTLGGTYINIGDTAKTHINPMDVSDFSSYDYSIKDFITSKYELFAAICSAAFHGDMSPELSAYAEKAVTDVYDQYFEKAGLNERGQFTNKNIEPPTIDSIIKCLESYDDEYAKLLALRMLPFKAGSSLDLFSHQTNVHIRNRVIGFGIRDLGDALRAVGMLIVLEFIKNRISENYKHGIRTHLYIDEFHELAKFPTSAKYVVTFWKEVRKWGGECTGITQNIVDLSNNGDISTTITNSEFTALFNQGQDDIDALTKLFNLSEAETSLIFNTDIAHGLLMFSDKKIPIDATIPKDSLIFQYLNTDAGNASGKKEKQKLSDAIARTFENRSLTDTSPGPSLENQLQLKLELRNIRKKNHF